MISEETRGKPRNRKAYELETVVATEVVVAQFNATAEAALCIRKKLKPTTSILGGTGRYKECLTKTSVDLWYCQHGEKWRILESIKRTFQAFGIMSRTSSKQKTA